MIGAYPFADQPFSAIAEEDDVSVGNPLTDLLSDPHADIAFLLRALPFDPATKEVRAVYVSSNGYATMGDGAGAVEGIGDHEPFPASLVSPFNFKVSLLSGGGFQASAIPGYGSIVIANPDGRHEDLIKLRWARRPVTVWAGRRQWTGPSFSQFGKVFQGTVESVSWDTSRITLQIRDLRHLFDQEANPAAYLGFGTAVRLRTAGDKVTLPYTTTQPFVEVMVEFEAPMRAGVVASKGGAAGLVLMVFADGAVGLFDRGITNYVVSATGVVTVGTPRRLSARATASGLRIMADGAEVAVNSTPFGGANASPWVIGALS